MSEPVAWVYPEFMKNIKDAKCWTAYATYHKDRPIPLYTHPMRELTDDEIVEVMCLGDKDVMLILELTPYAKEKMIQSLCDNPILIVLTYSGISKAYSLFKHARKKLNFNKQINNRI